MDLPELRDDLRRQVPPPADDLRPGQGPGQVRGIDPGQGHARKLRRQVFKLAHPFIRQADVVVAVVPVGMAVGHLAVAHQVDAGGGQGTLGGRSHGTHAPQSSSLALLGTTTTPSSVRWKRDASHWGS